LVCLIIFRDLPFDSEELLRILIALKTKRTLEDVPPAKSIKDLSGGKSTLQNEILADLQKEFGDVVPERPEELPIRDLGAHLRPHYKGAPGRYTSGLIGRLFSAKMAAGWNQASARDLLEKEFGLSVRAADQLLMYSLHMEPASRLASEDVAKVWLREVAAKFFGTHSLELPSAGGSGGNTEVAAVSSAELERLQSKQKRLIRQQIELFATYVEQNLLEFQAIAEDKSQQIALLQQDLDLWLAEFGPTFQDGVRPIFSNIKTRRYDSFWNWARQDVYMLYYDILFGRLVNVDRDVTAKCLHVMNRSSQDLVDFMEYHIVVKGPDLMHKGVTDEAYILTRRYGEMLITQVKEALNRAPVYKDVSLHTRPQVQISYDGSIEYSEVRRSGVSSFEAYVRELSRGSEKLGKTTFGGEPRPLLFIRERSTEDHTRWEYAQSKTNLYFEVMSDMAINGVSYEGKTALITGAGKGSIGSEIVKGLLSGGAKVVVTTSSFTRTTVDYFRAIYECHGARSSCLIIAPFNQGSMQDVESLIEFIYNKDSAKGLGWDLDYIVPFAAITENGREVTDLDGKSELAHRIMMTNVLRLAGLVARKKRERRIETRPAQVVLPLSPNHGIFGKDGLYSESKLGLETLFNRWHSEDWKDYLSVVGAVIGWTRGTGLMNENNLIAEAMERAGLRTFSSSEMAFNILALMHPRMVRLSEEGPLYGDLNGGLDVIKNLAEFTRDIRTNITDGAQIRRALAKERAMEASLEVNPVERVPTVQPRANMSFKYPELPNASQLPGNPLLAGLLDLSKVVVVTGFGEVGPWGNSRTRWEMEAAGELSLEACIEMAWLMGLVRYHTGVDAKGAPYTGWVDAATGSPVQDYDVKAKYEETILKHSGIRFVEPELFNGYDPQRKSFCQEIVIEYDMAPIEVTREEADHFKLMHGEKADVYQTGNGDSWNVKLRKGATIYVPKALRFDRLVAGQIPTGWNAERYGVPKDICQQVDPVTLFVLVSTVDALVSAGITDPYEFYQYVHLAEVGNTSGGGEGGMWMNKMIFQYRYLDKPVQADVLQETFINTMPAWVNLLLLSSSGPIKTPVGACATAVESVEIGVETILSGKAKIVIAGGYDDFQEESSYEFGSMQATSSGVEELAKGRQPDEMSRPTATSRAGFMESHGAGIQVLMTAELALQMGCPIYGIIALTNTATDKEGRSIPAPGQGILTTARSVRPDGYKPRLLDMEYRHSQLQKGLENIKLWLGDELLLVKEEADAIADPAERSVYLAGLVADIEKEAERREAAERQLWAFDFWKGDARIAPLEGALATYGLTVDDIGVGSFHGTGTKANDVNESDVVNKQLHHLGRTRGNLLPCICQKYLTGHPKGAAAAWMLNG
jgi:fatty acid synthase subunit beta